MTSLLDRLAPTTRERLVARAVDLAGVEATLLTQSGIVKPGCLRLESLEDLSAKVLPEHLVRLPRVVDTALQSEVQTTLKDLLGLDPIAASALDAHPDEASRLLRLAAEEGYRVGRFLLGTHQASDGRLLRDSDLNALVDLLAEDGDNNTYLDDLLGEPVKSAVSSLAEEVAALESRPLSRAGNKEHRLAQYEVLVSFGLEIAVSEFDLALTEADSAGPLQPGPATSDTAGSTAPKSGSEAQRSTGRPFCRACGSVLSTQASENCPHCGEGLTSTGDDLTAHVGQTVSFRSGLRRRTGLVVAQSDSGTTVTVLVDGTPTLVDVHKLKEMPSETKVPIPSAAYRLIVAATGSQREQRHRILEHLPALLTTVFARRGFALAAFQRGDAKGIVDHSGLSQTEQAWLLMWLAHNHGDSNAIIEHLSKLPADGYPDKVGVIAAHWELVSRESTRAVIAEHLNGVSEDPLAATLLFALGQRSWDDVQRVVATIPGMEAGVRLEGLGLTALRVFAGCETADSAPPDLLTPHASIVFALCHGSWPGKNPFVTCDAGNQLSSWQQGAVEAVISASEPLVDSLIDAGLLGPSFAEIAETEGNPDVAYLRARLAPEQLSEDELTAVGHVEESARRALIAGDKPTGDVAATRAFALLAALRTGDTSVLAELIPMLPERNRAAALAIGHSFRDGSIDVEALVDRSTWPVLTQFLPNGQKLNSAHPGVKQLSEWHSLDQAEQRLFEWDWNAAATAARSCLRTAHDEDIRDEALNLLACALHQNGNVEGARVALEEALAGVDSPELIINYGIVAGEDDKHAASAELARLAVEAPTLELRLTASRRALALWSDHVPGAGETDDPPPSLISAMRALSVEPTGLDEHTGIMRFLSWADDEWLADARHTLGSPYADTARHRFLVARAGGLQDALLALGELSGLYPEDEWLASERSAMAESWINIMLTNEECLPGLGMCGLNFMDSGMTLDPRQQILLSVLSVRELLIYMINDEDSDGTPKLALLDRLTTARQFLAANADLDAQLYGGLIDETVERFAIASWQGWIAEHDAIVDAHNSMLGHLRGMTKRQVNWNAVRETTAPMVTALNEMEHGIQRVLQEGVKDTKISESLRGLSGRVRELRQAVTGLSS